MKNPDKNEKLLVCDVDDTLIIWDSDYDTPGPGKIKVIDPGDGSSKYFKPHKRHIQLLEHFAHRGFYNIVWSNGGGDWANAVVDALGVRSHIHDVMCKPLKMMDDMDSELWMPKRIFIPQEEES